MESYVLTHSRLSKTELWENFNLCVRVAPWKQVRQQRDTFKYGNTGKQVRQQRDTFTYDRRGKQVRSRGKHLSTTEEGNKYAAEGNV